MELLDIVDENGNPIGKTVDRSIAHENGIRHRTAHVWILRFCDGVEEVLLQKRSMNKDSFPGRYDTSSAGHILAGTKPLDSAIRELKEELGINAKPEDLLYAGTFNVDYEKNFHDKEFKDKEIAFVYIYLKRVKIDELTIQKEELEQVEWFDIKEVISGCKEHNQKFCVPLNGLMLAKRRAEEERFKYGYDIDKYIEKALDKIRKTFVFATKEHLSPDDRYEIEVIDGEYEFVQYHKDSDGKVRVELHKCLAEIFIDYLAYKGERYIFIKNKIIDNYKVKYEGNVCMNGWNLEKYEFNKHESGDYSAFVQAGDRVAGASRDFPIPRDYLEGSYEEFLEKYLKLVPPSSFGLTKEHLIKDQGVRAFLGF